MNTGSAPEQNDSSAKPGTEIQLNSNDLECIQAAHRLLSEDPPPHISIEGLALEVRLNRTKLQYGFKQVYGTNIYDFQIEKRMEKAKLLLLTTDKQIKEIAPLSGYKKSSSFVAKFRKAIGFTPLQFRKKWKVHPLTYFLQTNNKGDERSI
jgi:AraC-like DNA-binding protein